MDVIEILSDQHRQVESLFQQFEATPDPAVRAGIAREVIVLLSRHSAVEEIDVYPVIAAEVGGEAAGSLTSEHQELKRTLADIEHLEPGSPELATRMAEAMVEVRQHVGEEEGEVFPRLRAAVAQDRLDELGRSVRSRWDAAPTHPHPNQPPANAVTGPVVGLIDKARDALTGD